MPIQVCCPQGHRLAVADKYAGQQVKCPKCQSALVVPGVNGAGNASAGDRALRSDKPSVRERVIVRPPPIPKPPIAASSVAPAVPPPVPAAAVTIRSVLDPAPTLPRLRAWSAEGVRGYRPELPRVHAVYLLTVGIVLMTGFQLVPAFSHWNPSTAPGWVRWLLMLSVVQLAYAIWMVSFPDWSTVRVTMFALAAVATLYGVALGIATVTPPERSLPFDLNDVRDQVRLWCGAVLLLLGLLIYICGRIAFRWRKAYWTVTRSA
jgi:hypothetical protein